jgi:hypothetical protein
LDNNPQFKALSYVWGNSFEKQSITVNHQLLEVTNNLFAGLQRLRQPEEIVVIWVDAVCIHQSDLDERCQQVQLMGDIYSSAEEVLIWLGYGGELRAPKEQPSTYRWAGDDTDMELVDAYFEKSLAPKNEGDEGNEDILGAFVFLKLRAMGKHLNELTFFDVDGNKLHARTNWLATVRAMDTLGSNSWWTRIWVVQETVLARKATVVYRHITAPWGILTEAAENSVQHDNFCCVDFLNTRPIEEEIVIIKLRRVIENLDTLEDMKA